MGPDRKSSALSANETLSPDAWSKSKPGEQHAPNAAAAFSIEFVTTPKDAPKAHTAIPTAIVGALGEVTGFAGCLVTISNQEARLVTVTVFWMGTDRFGRCHDNERWIYKLLAPYIDHCVRAQTLIAYLPAPKEQSSSASSGESEEQCFTDDQKQTCAG